jgi:hypothetical protein
MRAEVIVIQSLKVEVDVLNSLDFESALRVHRPKRRLPLPKQKLPGQDR